MQTILLAEDEEVLRKVLKDRLEEDGWTDEALEQLKEKERQSGLNML